MSLRTVAELAVWGGVGLLLTSILIDDLKNYRIRNTTVLILAGLFVGWCLIKGDPMLFVSHGTVAAIVFAILSLMYRFNMMGGGDVKLLSIAFLWFGAEQGFLFSMLLCVASLLYIVVARLAWVPSRKRGDRTSVPFGPSIAVAWITTILIAQVPGALT